MKLRTMMLASLAFAAVACGSTAGPSPDARGTLPTSPSPSTSVGSPPSTPGRTSTPARTSQPASPGPTVTSSSGPHSASLAKSCVHRGVATDKQSITVRTTPKGPASYLTVYSDGSYWDSNHPDYSSGGQNGGFADSSGTYRDSWVVPAAAPTGRAVVKVVVAGRREPIELPFTVVAQTGACP